jgi:hypothetical protein
MMSERRGETFVMADAPHEPVSFSAFILGLASSALIHLGHAPNPESGNSTVNLVLARQSLDLLDMLHAKTRGNLTSDEEQLFASLLTDLKFRFVEAARSR